VIGAPGSGHLRGMARHAAGATGGPASSSAALSLVVAHGAVAPPKSEARLRTIVAEQFDFVWRSLRRLGVPEIDVDDCAQQVFVVAARRLDDIQVGSERAFLFSTVMRVASDARRSRGRRREVLHDDIEVFDDAPDPEEIASAHSARAVLDEVLDALPMELRAVFVLFELEELTTAEIAAVLELPSGTVASRLRRAREEFHRVVARRKAHDAFSGGER